MGFRVGHLRTLRLRDRSPGDSYGCGTERLRASGRPRAARIGAAPDRRRGSTASSPGLRTRPPHARRTAQPHRGLVESTRFSRIPSTGARVEVRSSIALLEIDDEPAGYAVYRVASKWEDGTPKGEVRVMDSFASSPQATAELWRFLFGIDLVVRVKSETIDPAWPLFLMVADPRRLHLSVSDGLWLRLVDLEPALRARTLRHGRACRARGQRRDVRTQCRPLECRRGDRANRERGRRRARRRRPRLRLPRRVLVRTARGRRPGTRAPAGGLARATALFATPLPPYCPEGF